MTTYYSLNEDSLADVAQLAERVLGKDEVTSSILVIGSSDACRRQTRRAIGGRGVMAAAGMIETRKRRQTTEDR